MSDVLWAFRLYVQWRFMRGIEAQFLALQKGFNEIIPQHLLRTFDERELEVRSFLLLLSFVCVRVHVRMNEQQQETASISEVL